ncbi:unnamed protein product [Malus baccata var. baccata]
MLRDGNSNRAPEVTIYECLNKITGELIQVILDAGKRAGDAMHDFRVFLHRRACLQFQSLPDFTGDC